MTFFNNTSKFCHTCLKMNSNDNTFILMKFSTPGDSDYKTKLKYCVPEMNLENIDNSLLCKQCTISLDTAYLFRTMCLQTEEKLSRIRQAKKPNTQFTALTIKQEPFYRNPQFLEVSSLHYFSTGGAKKSLNNNRSTSMEGQRGRSTMAQILSKKQNLTRPKPTRRLTDNEIIQRCLRRIPDLKNRTKENLKCWVSLEKLTVTESPVKLHTLNLIPKPEFSLAPSTSKENGTVIKKEPPDIHSTGFSSGSSKKSTIKYKMRLKPLSNISSVTRLSNLKSVTKSLRSRISPFGIVTYHCDECSYSTVKKRIAQLHKMRHLGLKQFHCPHCSKSFYENWEAMRHVRDVHRNKNTERVAPLLIKKTSVSPEGKANLIVKTQETFHCNQCNSDFKTLAALKSHKKIHEKLHQCAGCPRKFESEIDLLHHLKESHGVENDDDDDNLNADDDLNAIHDFEVNEEIEQILPSGQTSERLEVQKARNKYYCRICYRYFASKDHVNVHTGAKPYECKHCSKTYTASSNLHKHVKKVHGKGSSQSRSNVKEKTINVQSHVCPNCKSEFESVELLYNHGCEITGTCPIITCQICYKAYLGRQALVEHMAVHINSIKESH